MSLGSGRPARVDPLRDIGARLLDVEKPARYLGGEFGASRKRDGEGSFDIALCFPDLYEIGMSNNAIRILYDGLNRIPSVRCERVFAPAPDFEALLKELGLPLYTLESGLPLHAVDLLGFSLGYELAATNLIAVLASGGIAIKAEERGESEPLVIAGGPAITNPHPFADFLDGAFIGEAEGSFFALAAELAALKAAGARRRDLLERLGRESAIWMPSRSAQAGKRAVRAVFGGFAEQSYGAGAPLPSVKTVQDHGTVEIMRGCPNGCRFCHAGYYYRPQRAKSFAAIDAEVESLVRGGGYREITLASLSSGDYPRLPELLAMLNARWAPDRVSFQLPSLKVNSFTLPLIAQLSEVRKSGLTFAVETPVDEWQRAVNKDVSFDKTLAILEEARARGFKQAKFYFMIGLPLPGRGKGEVEAIVAYFERLFSHTRMQINVNVGSFVPKPHTPFQWSAQLTEDESLEAINTLRSGLRQFKNLKLSYHSPFVSQLEGVISRGDERVGALLLEAYKRGARLDAWDEHFNRELWRSVIEGAGWDVVRECCGERALDAPLVWDDISVRVSKAAFIKELERSRDAILTDACAENCTHPCGSCSDASGIVIESEQAEPLPARPAREKRPVCGRFVFSYTKKGTAAYLQNLSLIDSFERAFLMADLGVAFSEGFNPMPRLEIMQPLPIAVSAEAEIATILMEEELAADAFVERVNACLPECLRIVEARWYPVQAGIKQRTIGSLSWGSVFLVSGGPADLADRISARVGELAIEGVSIQGFASESGSSIRVRLPDPSVKEAGLLRILESCIEARPVQRELRICRESCLADAGSGPVSFFEAYEQVSRRRES